MYSMAFIGACFFNSSNKSSRVCLVFLLPFIFSLGVLKIPDNSSQNFSNEISELSIAGASVGYGSLSFLSSLSLLITIDRGLAASSSSVSNSTEDESEKRAPTGCFESG
jgi:hypothetical protein